MSLKKGSHRKVVIFTSREDAERETGYFDVSSLMVSESLEEILLRFIQKNGLATYTQVNQSKTGFIYNTLNFTLKTYHSDEKRAYLTSNGRRGHFKSLKDRPQDNGEKPKITLTSDRPHREYARLKKVTPKFDQMYFWIAKKYPKDILWMSYSFEPHEPLI